MSNLTPHERAELNRKVAENGRAPILKIEMEATGRFEQFEGVLCRMWKGKTGDGLEVEIYVPCIRSKAGRDQAELDRTLSAVKADRQLTQFDTRLVI